MSFTRKDRATAEKEAATRTAAARLQGSAHVFYAERYPEENVSPALWSWGVAEYDKSLAVGIAQRIRFVDDGK